MYTCLSRKGGAAKAEYQCQAEAGVPPQRGQPIGVTGAPPPTMFGKTFGAAYDSTHSTHGALPEYVKLHPSDSGSGLVPASWECKFLSASVAGFERNEWIRRTG